MARADERTRPERMQAGIVEMLPRLRRFARALTGHAADADDIVQIAVERALMRLDQFEEGTRLDAWLYSIVRNAWIDEARARGRRAKVLAPEDAGLNVGDDGASAVYASLEAQDVWAAMQRLAPEQREVIALVCIEGLPYRDAAAQLDIPMGTLTSRLSRGREALQALLGATP